MLRGRIIPREAVRVRDPRDAAAYLSGSVIASM